jgi:hypothetical protein
MRKNWLYNRFNAFLERHMPEGLFPRALIILVAPVVLLQTIMTGLIVERHFENVTRLLARSFARDVSMLIQLYEESDREPCQRHTATQTLDRGWHAAGTPARATVLPRRHAPDPGTHHRNRQALLDRQPQPAGHRRCARSGG